MKYLAFTPAIAAIILSFVSSTCAQPIYRDSLFSPSAREVQEFDVREPLRAYVKAEYRREFDELDTRSFDLEGLEERTVMIGKPEQVKRGDRDSKSKDRPTKPTKGKRADHDSQSKDRPTKPTKGKRADRDSKSKDRPTKPTKPRSLE